MHRVKRSAYPLVITGNWGLTYTEVFFGIFGGCFTFPKAPAPHPPQLLYGKVAPGSG